MCKDTNTYNIHNNDNTVLKKKKKGRILFRIYFDRIKLLDLSKRINCFELVVVLKLFDLCKRIYCFELVIVVIIELF